MNTNGEAAQNGHADERKPSFSQQLREARQRLALAETQAQLAIYETYDPFGWNYSGISRYPSPFDGNVGPNGRIWMPIGVGSRTSRTDGANRPVIWNETDLDNMRWAARWLCDNNPFCIGATNVLRNYLVKTGYSYEAKPGKRYKQDQAAKELSNQIQEFIEAFQSLNVIGESEDIVPWADRERESVLRSVRDGEVFLRCFKQDDGSTWVRFVEPENIRMPLGEDPEWSFGLRNVPGDIERLTHIACHYDQGPDYDPVSVRDVALLRWNVDSAIKRGLSDFYPIGPAAEETWKLLRAMRLGATAQAGIAWIERHPQATQEALGALVNKRKDLNPPTFTDPISGRDVSGQHVIPGQRLLIGGNREYLPAPLAQNVTQHLQILAACLRSIAARWNMTESMISSDASNNNMASQLIAGAPFVTNAECWQAIYGRFFVRVFWIAIRNAAEAGRFVLDGQRVPYEVISRLVDISFTPPAVAIADKLQQSQIDNTDITNGVLSIQTRRALRGLDSDTEDANLKKLPPTRVAGKATDVDPSGNPVKPEDPGSVQAAEMQGLEQRFADLRSRYGDRLTEVVRAAAVAICEGCVPNKAGSGHHDDHTGAPCKVGGEDSNTGDTDEPHSDAETGKLGMLKRIGGKISGAVTGALAAIDDELKGGGSLIVAGLKSMSPSMVLHGVSRAITSAYGMAQGSMGDVEDAIEETFEAAMAQHSFGGAHAVAVMASKALAQGEKALQKGVAALLGKLGFGRTQEALEADQELPKEVAEFFTKIARQSAIAIKAAILEELGIKVTGKEDAAPNA